jgi:dipeptidyl aminopeptidase/acylaminoacyl peptidase
MDRAAFRRAPGMLVAGLCLAGAVASVHAQAPTAETEQQADTLSPRQTLERWQLSDVQISPDAARIALVVTSPVKGAERTSHIWQCDVASQEIRQLTASEKGERAPRWSPDASRLAFLSNRGENTQVFVLSMAGGEGVALTKDDISVASYAWSPDGSEIAFLAPEPQTEEERSRKEDKDDARVVDRDDRHARLWIIDVQSGEVRQLTEGAWRVAEFAWVPPGDRLIVSATDDPQPELETNNLYLVNADGGSPELLVSPGRPFGRLRVSPRGNAVAYVGTPADGPTTHDLWLQPLDGSPAQNLTAAPLDRPIGDYNWRDDRTLIASVADGFIAQFYSVETSGDVARLPESAVHPFGSFAATVDVLAFVGETTVDAPEMWVSLRGRAAELVTEFNRSWNDISTLPVEVFEYDSFDGTTIEAGLLLPAERPEATRLPLVVLVHGGPTGRWSDRFHSWGQLLAARGYAVFYPNVRGSTGYGHDFLAANKADWGGGDFRDVMAGVDHLIERGIADPDRLGIGGWSYGGYMAAWAVTQTDRFKASVSGAPMTDLASEYGTESAGINAYDTWFMGTPYENLEPFVERSPVTHVRNARTPTLILCGENDTTDPIGQCQQFYRGLKRYAVETQLVIYPREGHGIREENHQIDVLTRMLEWFDAHLK